ncbi:MAG TPA: hypothetical protein VHW96_11735 [Solirubrobacteraceae bacterium]|jgi:hypothetical protein|nr:hypothetical protein [Solirubrobacteraceae bacterium]
MSERTHPPFTEVGMLSLALVVIGGIYLSSHIPQHVALGLPTALLIASGLLVAGNLAVLSRVPNFAWPRFFQVGKWALGAYLFTAALIEFAFLRNHLKGGPLVILTLSLLVYAVQVPAMIAFTVARYDTSASDGGDGSLARS